MSEKATKSYTLLSPIKIGDEILGEGDSVDLTASEAKRLIHLGVVVAPPAKAEAPKTPAK